MLQYKHAVWLIRTPSGDALRAADDVEEGGEMVRLKRPCAAIPPEGVHRSSMQCMMFAQEVVVDGFPPPVCGCV
jgi:hypothetical protein